MYLHNIHFLYSRNLILSSNSTPIKNKLSTGGKKKHNLTVESYILFGRQN